MTLNFSTQNEESKGTSEAQSSSSLSNSELSGFIEKDDDIGKIEIKGFTLSIEGLSSEFKQKIPFILSEWRMLCTIIKYYSEPLKIMIGNYSANPEEKISRRKLLRALQKYAKYAEK